MRLHAAIVASAQDWSKAQSRGGNGNNQHKKEETGNVAALQTVAGRAAQSGASERTQRMADKVAKVHTVTTRARRYGRKRIVCLMTVCVGGALAH